MAALLPFLIVGLVVFFLFKLLPHFVRSIILLSLAAIVAVALLEHGVDVLAGAWSIGRDLFDRAPKVEHSVAKVTRTVAELKHLRRTTR
jgi:hypothetical protein